MKNVAQLLVIAILSTSVAHAAEGVPPPPPNPFSNLPAGGSEGFTPFDDDFDDANGAAGSFGGGNGGDSMGNPVGAGGATRGSRGAGGGMGEAIDGGGRGANGAGRGAKNPRMAPPASCKEVVENFDYPDAEILDVAKAIGKLTGKNFIYNPQDIKGRISVVSQTQITVCDAWNAFLTALNLRGFALVPSGKYLRIERIANAKEKQTPIYSDKKVPNNDEFITRVLPLRYIDATEFESAFRLWMPREARMQAYTQTNTIIITDTAAHINRMVELIQLLDVAGYQESLVVMPIRNAAAKDVAKLIESILNQNAASSSAGGFGMPRNNPYGAPAKTTRGRNGGSSISKIIADDRTNSLIVKANAAGIQEIRALVRRLDTKVAAAEGSGRIHVVGLRFANAEEMAKVLQSITTGNTGARSNRAFPTFGEAPQTFQSEIKVAPDKTTQSLVITASPQDFITVKKVIERLDQPRDQVYLEAMILEMNINRSNQFGMSFIAASSGIGLNSASGNLENLLRGIPPSGFVLGFKQGAQKANVDLGDGKPPLHVNDLNGVFELIQANSDSQIIATPQIIALDNEKAIFEVDETVPVETSTISNGTVSQSFTSDKATLLLEVTPQINKGSNFVKLDINQKMEAFDNTQVPQQLLGRANGKNSRATTTKLFVQSDDTVVLSGMIRSQVQEDVQKVPLLGDIPVIGWLFKNSSKKNVKTNLLVFITPRIIKQYDKIRKILADKLNERDDFVRETSGSIDPYGKEINKLKKGLPDLTVIEPLPQVKQLESSSFASPSSPDRDDEDQNQDQGFYDQGYNNQVPLEPMSPIPPPAIGDFNGGEGSPPPVVTPQDPGVIGQ
jgi:general secretion pathway protein D